MHSHPSMAAGCLSLAGPEIVASASCYPRPDATCSRVLAELGEAPVDGYCLDSRGTPIVVGKGHAAVILLAWSRGLGPVAVKVRRRDSKAESLQREAAYLARAFRAGAAPRPLWWGDEVIVMEYVEGTLLGEARIESETVAASLEAARALDAAGILHRELARPWRHVIIRSATAVIVDYDSARDGCGSVNRIASALVVRLTGAPPGGSLRLLLAEYKRTCDRIVFEEIKREVSSMACC